MPDWLNKVYKGINSFLNISQNMNTEKNIIYWTNTPSPEGGRAVPLVK